MFSFSHIDARRFSLGGHCRRLIHLKNISMKNSFNGRDFRLVTALAIVSLAAACGEKPKAPPPQPPEVGVYAAKTTPVPVVVELPGRVSAFLAAPIIARVDGIVLHRDFVEGSEVKAGQRLYQIDPAPYEATLESAKATLAKAQAAVVSAKAQADRYKILVAANAVSKQDYDNAVAAEGQDVADVAAGKASVKTAQINLGYTNIVSPITGRVGKSTVTPGAYVQANGAAPLATVQQLEPVYVDLTQSSLDGLKLRREIEAGRLTEGGPNAAKITLVLEDGKPYEAAGKLEFSDITVDQTTGSVTVRATFPNPKRVLLPGMFVHAQIEEGTNENAIVVPQVSVTHDQKGNPTAMVVGKDNKVELRQLKTSGTQGSNWIVESGLKAGDQVIAQGASKVAPGATVKPVPAQLPPEGQGASGASAATAADASGNGAPAGAADSSSAASPSDSSASAPRPSASSSSSSSLSPGSSPSASSPDSASSSHGFASRVLKALKPSKTKSASGASGASETGGASGETATPAAASDSGADPTPSASAVQSEINPASAPRTASNSGNGSPVKKGGQKTAPKSVPSDGTATVPGTQANFGAAASTGDAQAPMPAGPGNPVAGAQSSPSQSGGAQSGGSPSSDSSPKNSAGSPAAAGGSSASAQ